MKPERPSPRPIPEALAALEQAFAEALRSASKAALPQIVRASVPIETGLEPLAWLAHQPDAARTYWDDREGAFACAGVGSAHRCAGTPESVWQEVASMAAEAPEDARWFGGMAFFSDTPVPEEWQELGQAFFVLPRIELIDRPEGRRLACNALLRPGTDPAHELETLRADLRGLAWPEEDDPRGEAPLAPPRRADFPDRPGWLEMVEKALETIEAQHLEKVVLARKSVFETPEDLHPIALLRALSACTAQSFDFCFQPEAASAFIGASPERLYRRRGRAIESEALAGTRARGATPALDAALAKELLSSEKDRHEHGLVAQAIRAALAGLCAQVEEPSPTGLLQLHECQHLYCLIRGMLRAEVTDRQVLEVLHPTPAVGGCPTPEACRCLEHLEPFSRGWYAAPVGWLGRDEAEFAVAIRSGLVRSGRVHVFSGAGIVAASSPEEEWEEIETKMGSFLRALGHPREAPGHHE